MEINARELLQYKNRYETARYNLLAVIIFTVINCLLVSTERYFLFSAFIPLYFVRENFYMHMDEYWADVPEMDLQEMAPIVDVIGFVFVALAVVGIVLYLMCWLFSKKRRGWMIAALVFFSIDSAFLLLNFSLDMILDIAFHGLVMYHLITGVIAASKLRTLEEYGVEEPVAETFNETVGEFANQPTVEEEQNNENN